MMCKVNNAIILAAGISSRFAPLSFEKHKALISVRGEILIERQICQLLSAGIKEIVIITGYKCDSFDYLKEKYNVKLIYNHEFSIRNNHSSIYAARDYLGNSFICSSDNYFITNPFELEVDDSYYASIFIRGNTPEWCVTEGNDGYINNVNISGSNSWVMLGHSFWNEQFSEKFLNILHSEYNLPETQNLLWEHIFINHLDVLKMRIRKYPSDFIFEFDSLNELRAFDTSYNDDTRSTIIKQISCDFNCQERELRDFFPIYDGKKNIGFYFTYNSTMYRYLYEKKLAEKDY